MHVEPEEGNKKAQLCFPYNPSVDVFELVIWARRSFSANHLSYIYWLFCFDDYSNWGFSAAAHVNDQVIVANGVN